MNQNTKDESNKEQIKNDFMKMYEGVLFYRDPSRDEEKAMNELSGYPMLENGNVVYPNEITVTSFVRLAAQRFPRPVIIEDFPRTKKLYLVCHFHSLGVDVNVVAKTKEDAIAYIKEQYDEDEQEQWQNWDQEGEQRVGMNRIIEVDMNMVVKRLSELI